MLSFTFLEAQKEPRASFFRQPKYAIRLTIKSVCLLIKDKQGIMFYCYSQLFPFMSPIVSAVGGLQAAREKTERAAVLFCLCCGRAACDLLLHHKTQKGMLFQLLYVSVCVYVSIKPQWGQNEQANLSICPHRYFINYDLLESILRGVSLPTHRSIYPLCLKSLRIEIRQMLVNNENFIKQ